MEFMTGVKKKEDISVKTLLETPEGTEVKLEGAVHIIRDMGEVAFVILRKSEGLVQCVYEEGSVDFPLKDLKEESAVAVTGTVKKEDRAPGGVEVRLQTITEVQFAHCLLEFFGKTVIHAVLHIKARGGDAHLSRVAELEARQHVCRAVDVRIRGFLARAPAAPRA